MPVYTIADIFALRGRAILPNGSELLLKLQKEYASLLREGPRHLPVNPQVEYRYQLGISNSLFKRQYIRAHGHIPDKSLKTYKVYVMPKNVAFLEEYLKQVLNLEKRILRLQLRMKTKPRITKVIKAAKAVIDQKVKIMEGKPLKDRTVVRIVRINTDYNSGFQSNYMHYNVLGGRQSTGKLPKREHTKYWYFLRKRGVWEKSQHHPYGDE
jgi:hypothetical protein